FLLWQKLREDYEPEQLFTLWLWLVVVAWLGSGVWVWWTNNLRQTWGALILPLLFLLYWSRKYKWDFWQVLDVFGPLTLAVITLAALGWGPNLWQIALAGTGGIVATSIVRHFYRRWHWYRSGRSGLVGLVAVLVWGIINLVVANFHLWAVYSMMWMSIVIGVAIYIRSGRQISHLWPSKNKKVAKA
ncbi:MAG: hypothetical protein Q7S31_01905, partial [bacterium]|nr:hypothetical protein [bacterium]